MHQISYAYISNIWANYFLHVQLMKCLAILEGTVITSFSMLDFNKVCETLGDFFLKVRHFCHFTQNDSSLNYLWTLKTPQNPFDQRLHWDTKNEHVLPQATLSYSLPIFDELCTDLHKLVVWSINGPDCTAWNTCGIAMPCRMGEKWAEKKHRHLAVYRNQPCCRHSTSSPSNTL